MFTAASELKVKPCPPALTLTAPEPPVVKETTPDPLNVKSDKLLIVKSKAPPSIVVSLLSVPPNSTLSETTDKPLAVLTESVPPNSS